MPDNKLVRFDDGMSNEDIRAFIAQRYPDAYNQPKTRGQRALDSLKHNAEDMLYGVRRGLSGATLGASEWALRKMGVGDDYMKRREAEGLGGAAKIGGLAAEIGGNVMGLGGKITKGLSGMGFEGVGLLGRDAALQGGIYGLTSSDRLSDAPINTVMGGVGGVAFAGAMQVGLSALGTAVNYLRTDVQRGITYMRKTLGDKLTNYFIKKARQSGEPLVAVVNDEALDIAQRVRQQTPKARYKMSENIENNLLGEVDANNKYINDTLGSKSGFETVEDVQAAAKEKARPIYERLQGRDLAQEGNFNVYNDNNLGYNSTNFTGENNGKIGQLRERGIGTPQTTNQSAINGAETEKSAALRDLVKFGQDSQRASRNGIFVSRNDGTRQSFVVNPETESLFDKGNISKIGYEKLQQTPQDARRFFDAITKAKKELGALGEQVWTYSPEEYQKMTLLLSDDGLSGIAVKPDGDIVSVFANPNAKLSDYIGSRAHAMVELAKQLGGKKLDAFDTFLPKLYSKHGFKEVGRDVWNEEIAKTELKNWDKNFFKQWNNGEPDVVYMSLEEPKDQITEYVKKNPFVQSEISNVRKDLTLPQSVREAPDTSFDILNAVKKNIDDKINVAKRQGENELVSRLTGIKNELVGQIDAVAPEYAEARKIYENAYRFTDASELGKDVFSNSSSKSPERFAKEYGKLSGEEKEAVKLGMRDELKNIINGKENPALGWKRVINENTQQKIRTVLGKEADGLIARANTKIRKMRNMNKLLSGSQTSEKQNLRDAYGLATEVASAPQGAIGSVLKRVPWNDGRNMGIAEIMTNPKLNLEAEFAESVNPQGRINALYEFLTNPTDKRTNYQSALAAYLAGLSLKD